MPGPRDTSTKIKDLRHPGAEELLTHSKLARLAYNGLDDFPRVIPIGFLWNGERIAVCTAPSSPKVRALSARPHVALTIDTEDGTSSRALLVRGVAGIEIVDGARQFEVNVRSVHDQMARIAIEPRCIHISQAAVPAASPWVRHRCSHRRPTGRADSAQWLQALDPSNSRRESGVPGLHEMHSGSPGMKPVVDRGNCPLSGDLSSTTWPAPRPGLSLSPAH